LSLKYFTTQTKVYEAGMTLLLRLSI